MKETPRQARRRRKKSTEAAQARRENYRNWQAVQRVKKDIIRQVGAGTYQAPEFA